MKKENRKKVNKKAKLDKNLSKDEFGLPIYDIK